MGDPPLQACSRKGHWIGWIVLALCLLSFVRGVYQLGEQSLWWDESLSLHRATRPFSFIFSNRILFLFGSEEQPVTPDHHPPLYFAALRLLVLAGGDSEFVLRYLSLAACVLIVPLLYQCGRRLFGPLAGVGGALLAAASPLYLWAQQEARPYALATLFGVLSFYALLHLLEERPAGSPAPRRSADQLGWGALYAGATVAMLGTHYHTLQLLPAYGAIYILARGHRQGLTWWPLLAAGAAGAAIAMYGLSQIMPPPDVPGYTFIPLPTLLQDVLRAFPLGVSGTRLVLYQWVAGGLLLAALGILFTRPKETSRRHAGYLLLCLVLPVAEMYAVSYVRPVYMNIRHLIFASPFYYMLLAAGVAQARHVRLGKATRALLIVPAGAMVAVLLVGMGLSTRTYFVDPQYDKEDHRAWGRYLTEHVRPRDVVVIYPGAVYELYTYYSSSPAPYYGFPLHMAPSAEETIRRLQELGQQYERIWVAHSLTPGWAYQGDVTLDWLEKNAVQIAHERFPGHLNTFPVYAFSLEPMILDTLPQEASPLALDLGGELHLLGVRSIDASVAAGSPLRLSLYWSTAQPLTQEYRFALSVTDQAGMVWASLDYVPYDGTYPPTAWPVGPIVRDDVDVDLPPGAPPGHYSLNVSAYPADHSGPSLPVRELDSGQLMGLVVPIAEVPVVRPEVPPLEREVSILHRARARYGALTLLGHDFRGGTYAPGDALYLDLYWRARRAPRNDVALNLQLVDEQGTVQATLPLAPVDGYPAGQWRQGDLLEGKHRFRLPLDLPAGPYTLWLAPGDGAGSGIWPWNGRRVQLGALSVASWAGEQAIEMPATQYTLHANLDDQVELLGYDLEQSTIHPGDTVSCTLYWRGLQEMSHDYTVFTHLIGPDGQTWGQWDNEPQRGQAPTTRWLPGQVIADPYQIPLSGEAQAGPLTLQVGMYDLQTMARLPVIDENGTVTGDAIRVAELEIIKEEQ
jgi:hypothetical protein